jgi:hypothetical protein
MPTVQCPCGQSFERKPQRGRPAVWCEKCRLLPMNQRAARPIETDEDGEPVEVKPSRYAHDVLNGEQRDRIEEGVAEVYRTFVHNPNANPLAESFRLQYELTKVYNAVDPKKWPLRDVGGGE